MQKQLHVLVKLFYIALMLIAILVLGFAVQMVAFGVGWALEESGYSGVIAELLYYSTYPLGLILAIRFTRDIWQVWCETLQCV